VTTPEGKVKDAVKKVLGKVRPGLWWYMPVQYGTGVSGVPDFVGCSRGRFFAVEAKAAGKKPSALQRLALEDMELAEGKVFVITGERDPVLDELERWLRPIAF
jgi:hypothetical protein